MYHRVWLPIALVVLGVRCHPVDQSSTSNEAGGGPLAPAPAIPAPLDTTVLKGTALVGADLLSMPARLAVVGRHLVILDIASDSCVLVVDRSTGREVARLGRRGAGPGEVKGPWSLASVAGSDSRFWVFDFSLRRLTEYDLDGTVASAERKAFTRRMVTLESPATVYDPIWLGDSVVVALGFFDRGRLAQFDSVGRFLRLVGPTPEAGRDVPVPVAQHAFQGSLARSPNGRALVVVTLHAGQIEVYQPHGTLVTQRRVVDFGPRFRVVRGARGPAMVTGDDTRFGYISVATTPARVYALYSGFTRAERPGEASFGRVIHVFDWAGLTRGILKLDAPAVAIAVDDSAQTLYAIHHLPGPVVKAYSLRGAP